MEPTQLSLNTTLFSVCFGDQNKFESIGFGIWFLDCCLVAEKGWKWENFRIIIFETIENTNPYPTEPLAWLCWIFYVFGNLLQYETWSFENFHFIFLPPFFSTTKQMVRKSSQERGWFSRFWCLFILFNFLGKLIFLIRNSWNMLFCFDFAVVHGVEYAFGAHEHPTTGIFEVEPKQCPGFTFRKSILIGRTDLGPKDVRSFMEKLAEEYSGNTYNLITRNCNHFCNDVCNRLTGKPIPRWVNRLARLGKKWIALLLFVYCFWESWTDGEKDRKL